MKKRHKTNCRCMVCRHGFEAVRKMEQDAVKKCGWYAHYVYPDDSYPFELNAHTHGFPEKYGCRDLQIVAPVSDQTTYGIFWACAHLLDVGRTFIDGTIAHDVLNNFPVKFVNARECDRLVLRLILPDKQGRLERGEIDEYFGLQYPPFERREIVTRNN